MRLQTLIVRRQLLKQTEEEAVIYYEDKLIVLQLEGNHT